MRLTIPLSRSKFYNPKTDTLYYIGLDLGQVRDYSAVSIIEKPTGVPFTYRIRGLKRFPLKTAYTKIAADMKRIVRMPEIQPNLFVIDNTGVGGAVSDLFKEAGLIFGAITITGGDKASKCGNSIKVPKRDLVSTLQVLLQSGRLKIAERLKDSQVLVEELLNFQVRISNSGNDIYGAWREGTHDDLVLATAMACWASEVRLLPPGLRNPRKKSSRKRKIHSN